MAYATPKNKNKIIVRRIEYFINKDTELCFEHKELELTRKKKQAHSAYGLDITINQGFIYLYSPARPAVKVRDAKQMSDLGRAHTETWRLQAQELKMPIVKHRR